MQEQGQTPKGRLMREQTHRRCLGWCACRSKGKRSCKVLFVELGVKKVGGEWSPRGRREKTAGLFWLRWMLDVQRRQWQLGWKTQPKVSEHILQIAHLHCYNRNE
jgi:hypothetical protein